VGLPRAGWREVDSKGAADAKAAMKEARMIVVFILMVGGEKKLIETEAIEIEG
jgi:hypothetical protein